MINSNNVTLVCQKLGLSVRTKTDSSLSTVIVFVQGQLAARIPWKNASVYVSSTACSIPYGCFDTAVVRFLDHSCSVSVSVVEPGGGTCTAQRRLYGNRIAVPRSSVQSVSLPGRLVVASLTPEDSIHKWVFNLPVKDEQVFYKIDINFESTSATLVSWFLHTSQKRKRRRWNQGTVAEEQTTQSTFVATVPANRKSALECIVQSMGGNTLRYNITSQVIRMGEDPSIDPPITAPQKPLRQRRRAIIVGISRYRRESVRPLEYCDEDADAWYRYLTDRGYDCTILGDEFNWYPRWDGPATVQNVRECVQTAAKQNGDGDRLVFVTSSHGSGNGKGDSHLCLLADVSSSIPHEAQGEYWDTELAADLGAPENVGMNFLCFDACFSGGLIDELIDSVKNVCGTSTCTANGYGYDMASLKHGAWTSEFLCRNLMSPISTLSNDLYDVFIRAAGAYRRQHSAKGDAPCFFGRTGEFRFSSLNGCGHAYDRFQVTDVL